MASLPERQADWSRSRVVNGETSKASIAVDELSQVAEKESVTSINLRDSIADDKSLEQLAGFANLK